MEERSYRMLFAPPFLELIHTHCAWEGCIWEGSPEDLDGIKLGYEVLFAIEQCVIGVPQTQP